MVMLAVITPRQNEWLCDNDWFIWLYIFVIAMGIFMHLVGISLKKANSNKLKPVDEDEEINNYPKSKRNTVIRKTLPSFVSIVGGLILGIGLPVFFFFIILFLAN